MKKLLSIFLAVALVLSLSSFMIDAKTYSGSFPDFTLSADTPTEANTIADGLRIYINDTTANNPGCKVTFYFKYKGFSDLFNEPAIRLNVNWSAIGYLQQTVPLEGNSVTFDWDTVMSRANWPTRQGNIWEITLTSNADVVLTGVSVYVPEVQELAAGAPVFDTARELTP